MVKEQRMTQVQSQVYGGKRPQGADVVVESKSRSLCGCGNEARLDALGTKLAPQPPSAAILLFPSLLSLRCTFLSRGGKETLAMSTSLYPLASLAQIEKTPSREDDIPEDLELDLRAYGCKLIHEAGMLLRQ